MTCPDCNHDTIVHSTDEGHKHQCLGCGAHWRERDGKITRVVVPTKPTNPADEVREILVRSGCYVPADEEWLEEMRRYCDEPVESVEPLHALTPEHWHHRL